MSTEIITRAEALAKGLKQYFTGKPCRRGHVAHRRLMGGKDGVCVECRKVNTATYRNNNREKHNSWGKRNPKARRASSKRYDEAYPDRRKKSRLEWFYRNRAKQRVYQLKLNKRRRQTDPDYRLRCNLRGRIHKAIRRGDGLKSGKTLELIGCTVLELRAHLERLFAPGMTWSNYGHGYDKWSIDHVVPCVSFDLTDPAQQRLCFHFTNLQPLWHPENVAKGSKWLSSPTR
jgi:hypothetical protein